MGKYEQTRADYERLRELMGEPGRLSQVYDFTGGFCFEESGMELMKVPTKAKAASIYERLIVYGFQSGWESVSGTNEGRIMPDMDNWEIAEIAERYGFYAEGPTHDQ
jgi:hypothetical protein